MKAYSEALAQKNIPYFWYEDFNLIGKTPNDTIANISNRVKRIFKKLDEEPDLNLLKIYIGKF